MDYIDDKQYKSDITAKIIKGAYQVHNNLGIGFQEIIYQRALAIELGELGLNFEREKEMLIFYKELEIGQRRVDFLVEDDIMVELKALVQLDDVHIAQLMNYIEAYKTKVGLLINFGAKKLEVKRFIK